MARRFFDYRFKPFFTLGVVIVLSLFTEESMAIGNIHIEALKIQPSMTVEREYSDNFFPRDFKTVIGQNGELKNVKIKTSESVIRFKPSLDLSLPFRQNSFDLHYEMRYLDFQDLNQFDTMSHMVASKSKWYFISGLTAEVKNSFQYAESIPAHIYQEVQQYRSNDLSILTSYALGRRYIVELEFKKYLIRFKENQFQPDNTDDTKIISTILYQIMPVTFVGFEYTYERYDRKDLPEQNKDYTAQYYWVTIKFDDPQGRLDGQFKAGTQKLVYDDQTLNTGNSFFGFSSDLTFRKSKYTKIVFSGRRFQATTGVTTEDAQYGASFTNTMLSLSLDHKFTYKISGKIGFAYTETKFNSQVASGFIGGIIEQLNFNRTDNQKKWTGELSYQMTDWLGFKARYIYTDNKSNVYVEAFKRNQFFTEITLKF
jgi:hypothetical protein